MTGTTDTSTERDALTERLMRATVRAAIELDLERVDPSFDAFLSVAEVAVSALRDNAEQARWIADTGSVGIVALALAVMGMVLWPASAADRPRYGFHGASDSRPQRAALSRALVKVQRSSWQSLIEMGQCSTQALP